MPDLFGPVRPSRFEVELELTDGSVNGWKRVNLPSHSTQMNEYREGNDPVWNRPLWGQTSYEDLEMERGAKSGDTQLHDWRKMVVDGKMEEARKDLAVSVMNSMGEPELRFEYRGAWPKEYQPPTLDATNGGGGVATETVIVAYNEMERTE